MANYPANLAELTSVTRLYDDYINGRLAGILGGGFSDSARIEIAANQIILRSYPREELIPILRRGNLAFGASDATMANIERLGDSQSLCVFAGQQTGIFLGPMYTVYKALAAVKLAAKYQKMLNHPVIPCFWMATDDHDFAEISSVGVLGRGGELANIVYDSPNSKIGLPVSSVCLDENIDRLLDQFEQISLDTEFKKPLLDFIKATHKPGTPIAESFAGLFNHLMGEYGIVLVDPNFPEMKRYFKRLFSYEIENHQKFFSAFNARSKQLIDKGYHTQIHKASGILNLFYHNPQRMNLLLKGDSYQVDKTDQIYSKSQLLEQVNQTPEIFSPNALLRPIAQAAVFPTLCQITGPSELAYFAQIEPLFELFGVPFPIVFPRPGMTLLEPQVKRIIDKYQLDLKHLKNNVEQTIGEVINRLFPSDAANEVDQLRENLKQRLNNISDNLKLSDPEGFQLAGHFIKKIDFEFLEFQKKLKAANKKRHDDLAAQIKRTRDFVFPDSNLQERIVSPVYYANKFGPKIFDEIYNSLDIEQANHMVMEV